MPNAGQTLARCEKESSIPSDAELLARFKKDRDEPAFAEFVDRHAAMVMGICRRLLTDRADAEDAYQATFFVLAMRLRRHEPPALPANWLYVVARRTALKAKSAKWRRETRLRRIAEMKTNETHAPEELAGILDAELAKLPARLRSAVVLCYLEGKTNRQAARILGWPIGTLATRLRQARELLRKRLARRGYVCTVGMIGANLMRHLPPPGVPQALTASTAKGAVLLMHGTTSMLGASTAVGLAKAVARKMVVHHIQLAATLLLLPSLVVWLVATPLVSSQSQRSVAAAPANLPAAAPASRPSTPATSENSLDRIRRVGLAVMMYCGGHKDKFPPDLGAALPYAGRSAREFISPEDEARNAIPREPSADWINAHTSFVYLGSAEMTFRRLEQLGVRGPGTVMIYQQLKPGSDAPVAVGFFDGHAEWLARPVAEQLIRESIAKLASMHPGGAHPPILPPATPAHPDPLSVPWQPTKSIDLPVDLRKALENNARELLPLDVSWAEHGIATIPQDQPIARYPDMPQSSLPWSARAIAQPGRSYVLSRSPKGNTNEESSDGRIYYIRNFDASALGNQPRAMLTRRLVGALKRNLITDNWLPAGYFGRIGFKTRQFSIAGQLDTQSEILWDLDHGARLVSVDKAAVDQRDLTRVTLVLENPDWQQLHTLPKQMNIVFYLDPLMHEALRRREERYGPRLLSQIDNDQFHKLDGRDLWLPSRSKQDFYSWRSLPGTYFKTPIFSDVYEVKQISGQAAGDKQFVLEPVVSPTRVTDATLPGKPLTYDSPAVSGAKQP